MPDAIRLVCPECDAVHRVKEITLGKLYRCKKCKSGLITMTPAVLVCPSCGSTTPPSHVEVSRLVTCQECEDAPLMTVRIAGAGQSTRLHRDSTRDFARDQNREAGGFLADEVEDSALVAAPHTNDGAVDEVAGGESIADAGGRDMTPSPARPPIEADFPPVEAAPERTGQSAGCAEEPDEAPELAPVINRPSGDAPSLAISFPADSVVAKAQDGANGAFAASPPVRKQSSGAPVINPQYAAREKAAVERAQAARAAAAASLPIPAPGTEPDSLALQEPSARTHMPKPIDAARPLGAPSVPAASVPSVSTEPAYRAPELPAAAAASSAHAGDRNRAGEVDDLGGAAASEQEPDGRSPVKQRSGLDRSSAPLAPSTAPDRSLPVELPATAAVNPPSMPRPQGQVAVTAGQPGKPEEPARPPRRLHDTAFIARRSAELLEHAEKTLAESFQEEQQPVRVGTSTSPLPSDSLTALGEEPAVAAAQRVSVPLHQEPAQAALPAANAGAEGLDLQRLRQIVLDLQQPYLQELSRSRLHVPVWIPVAFALLLFGLFGWLIGSLDSLRDEVALKNRQLESKEQELGRQQNRLDHERTRLAGDNQRLIQLIPQLQQAQGEKLRLEKDLEEVLHKFDALQQKYTALQQQKKFSGFPAGPELGPNE